MLRHFSTVLILLVSAAPLCAGGRYFEVRYPPSKEPGELQLGVTYTLWLPDNIKHVRGVIVHQHGCGVGACKGGETAAYDLHWQALAKKWDCALLGPSYHQDEKQNCRLWCDPRNGSNKTFLKALDDLARDAKHPELAAAPWCLWGHSGGGFWASLMQTMYPDRIVAIWFRSGTAFGAWEKGDIERPKIPDAAYGIPVMMNPGGKEKDDKRFAGAWTGTFNMFKAYRAKGAPAGFAPDPRTAHECGDSRYLAIPFFDACLAVRLPVDGVKLRAIASRAAWLAEPLSEVATPADAYRGKSDEAVWLPNERVAKAWMQYVKTGAVEDTTPPPAPYAVKTTASDKGVEITWDADADFESGIKHFIIERDGKQIGQVPEKAIGRFGRPLFQSMSYHDTPERPLPAMRFVDTTAKAGAKHDYRVIAVNSVGLKSESPKTASTPKPAATDADMRQAVERALPFLLEGGEQWRLGKTAGGQAGRICVTCHQIPFTIWPHNEAKARGFKIEQARLDDLSQWALEWCAVQKHPKTQSHTGGFLSTMQQMIMGRSAATPDKAALDTYTLFGKVIGSMQKEDGWWREGNQIKGKSTQRESDEVDTMWIILGLSSLEKIKLPKQTLDASAQHRQRAMKWLSEGKPGERIDWLALRMLLEREFGDAKKVGDWQKQVLALQNADGGWPLMKGEKSHPLVTGQSLYALNLVGLPREDPAIRRGASFLVNTQEKNGSWKALSRNAAHSNIVTIHWGTGWATIGLVRALP